LHLLAGVVNLVFGDGFLKFVASYPSVAIRINHDEELSQLIDAMLRELGGKVNQCRLLEIYCLHEILHIVKGVTGYRGVYDVLYILDPRVVEGISRSVTLIDILYKEA